MIESDDSLVLTDIALEVFKLTETRQKPGAIIKDIIETTAYQNTDCILSTMITAGLEVNGIISWRNR